MKTKDILLTLVLCGIFVGGCKPDSIKNFTPRNTGDVASITGAWKGVSATQRDNDAERKNFPYKSEDVTSALEFSKVTITLNSANGQSTTFSINYGGAPPFFKLTSGNWKVDNATKVGNLSLYNGPDTVKFTLGSYLMIDASMLQLKQSKTLLGKEVITYEFNLSK